MSGPASTPSSTPHEAPHEDAGVRPRCRRTFPRGPRVNDLDLDVILLLGAAVLLSGVLAVWISSRLGMPSLLLYLGIGLAIGEAGLGIRFDDADLTRDLGTFALVLILAEGGLTTRWRAVRGGLPTAVSLSTVGVLVSALATGAVAKLVLDEDWKTSLLLGAVVSSTDAAAVFSVLRSLGLRRRLSAVLELESGLNDALAVILVEVLSGDDADRWYVLAGLPVYELLVGAALGGATGWLAAHVLRRGALPAAGLYPLATVAFAVLAFAVASIAHASGFAAVYVAAVVLGNSHLPHRRSTLGFAEGVGWLAQIGLFVLLGLLASPQRLDEVILPALAVGFALLLVARPLSVVLSTLRAFTLREQAFLSWAGLRGAVPIVLATIPVTEGLREGTRLFDIVFVLVVIFTLVQGTTLPVLARRLGVATAGEAREVEVEAAPLSELHADLLQLRVPPDSRLHGVYVSELRLPEGAALSLVVRDGAAFVPGPQDRIVRGDELLVVATPQCREPAEQRLRDLSRDGRLARWYRPQPRTTRGG